MRNNTFFAAVWLPLPLVLAASLTGTNCGGSRQPAPAMAAPAAPPVDLTFSPSPQSPVSAANDSELSHALAAGTPVPVSLKSVVDSAAMTAGFVAGTVDSDVKGTDGRVAIPAGSAATMFVRGLGRKGRVSEVDIGLYTINVLGRQYSFTTGPSDAATLVITEDSGLGPGHTSVHLYYNQALPFKLDRAVQLH